MIRFRITKTFEIGKVVLYLFDIIIDKGHKYADTFVGAWDEMLIINTGIIFDGKQERAMADEFDKVLTKKKILFTREDIPGEEWYLARDFYEEKV